VADRESAAAPGQCPAVSKHHVCYLVSGHPGRVHFDLSAGWPQPWMLPDTAWRNIASVPADPLQDAPEALRRYEETGHGHEGAWRACAWDE